MSYLLFKRWLLPRVAVALAMAMLGSPVGAQERHAGREQAVKRQIIEESITAYPGRCPCPYNVTRNGSACGGRSAWSRKGGYAPICYENEVTMDMVRARLERDRKRSRQESAMVADR